MTMWEAKSRTVSETVTTGQEARPMGSGGQLEGKGHPRFLELLDEMRELHLRKGADYGSDGDPLANLRASERFGVEPWLGTLIRLNDKVHRLAEFARKRSLANEGVADSLIDLAAYALLVLCLYEERQAQEAGK